MHGRKWASARLLKPATSRQALSLRRLCNERKPDFSFDKSESSSGYSAFSKLWLESNKLIVGIDWGVKRQALSFDLGIKNPEFSIDIAVFFGGSQSWYEYDTPDDLVIAMLKGLQLIDELQPHFERNVEDALRERDTFRVTHLEAPCQVKKPTP